MDIVFGCLAAVQEDRHRIEALFTEVQQSFVTLNVFSLVDDSRGSEFT